MKEEYESLVEEYDIPKLESMEKDFGMIDFDSDNPLLIEIRRKMVEKIDYFANLLSDFLQPDTNITSIYETKYIKDKRRKNLFNIFKILMAYSRKSSSLSTFYNKEDEIEFIKVFFNDWQTLKEMIRKELEFLSDKWSSENGMEEHFENYMG